MDVATLNRWRGLRLVIAVVVLGLSVSTTSAAQSGTTVRVSENALGVQSNGSSGIFWDGRIISPDGRWVVFYSDSTNLVAPSAIGNDVFLKDLRTGSIELVSVGNAGNPGDSDSGPGYLSADARFIYFRSDAGNLVVGDLNNETDIFVRDRAMATTELVTLTWKGRQANDSCGLFRVAATARAVVFESWATNLVMGDTNGKADIFVRDIDAQTTSRVSVSSAGAEANAQSYSPDIDELGRWVVFSSPATNLVAGDTNGTWDVFLHDRSNLTTSRVSLSASGAEANDASDHPCIAAGGRFVAFWSAATNLVSGDTNGHPDIFVRDLLLGGTVLVSRNNLGAQANDYSEFASISADGQRITFESPATNLVSPSTFGLEVFLRDLTLNKTYLISQNTSGASGNGSSSRGAVCANGRFVVFESDATNLVIPDTNNRSDVFVREFDAVPPIIYCPPKMNSMGCAPVLETTGTASASSGQPFWITASSVLNNKAGLLVYGTSSSTLLPFQAGWLCVAPPLRRTSATMAGGSPPPSIDCSGNYRFDFNAWIQGGNDPTLVAGQGVWAQFWSRDQGFAFPNNSGLTGAVALEIAP